MHCPTGDCATSTQRMQASHKAEDHSVPPKLHIPCGRSIIKDPHMNHVARLARHVKREVPPHDHVPRAPKFLVQIFLD